MYIISVSALIGVNNIVHYIIGYMHGAAENVNNNINAIHAELMNHLLFIGVGQIVIIALVVLLLFGGTKIPELMKGLGKGYKIFKDEVDNIEKNIK